MARTQADRPRPDLRDRGPHGPPCGFQIDFVPPLASNPQRIAVSREADGTALAGSPVTLPGLRGQIDELTRERARGWAYDTEHPDAPVDLVITVDGEPVARAVANVMRDDLVRHEIGNGRHSFDVTFTPHLSRLRHVVAICRASDGAHLAQSPISLETPQHFDPSVQASIAATLDTADTDEEIRVRMDFLVAQMGRLLLRRSERQVRRSERLAAQTFQHRWAGAAPATAPGAGTAPLTRRALMIDSTLPDLGRDAGSAAIVSHAVTLQRLGFEVAFVAADLSAKGAGALERLGIACYHAPWFGSVEELLHAQSHCFDLVYMHRVSCALPYTALVRRHFPRAKLIYSVADLHHLRLGRQADVENRPELHHEAQDLKRQELLAALQADRVITHSAHEAALLRDAMPSLRVHVVPWAVPLAPRDASFDARSGLAFIGHYGHPPNIEAALWLTEEVMPRLQAIDPRITCQLVGTAMPGQLQRPHPGVEIVGAVDDLPALLARVRLTVAPLLYGAGIKGKVLDSLAAGVPCVCTPVAAEGLELGPALRSLIAHDAAGFAASIHRLHTDPGLHAACRQEGLDTIANHFAQDRIDALMRAAIQ